MPTLTDPDADEKYAPKVDTQHGTTDMSEFEREFDGSRTSIVGSDLRGRENKVAQQSVNSESAGRSVDPKSLDNKEQEIPPDRSGFSAADDMRERLGRGYTGKGSTKSKGLSKLYSSNSKFKKKVAIAGAAAGGSLLIGVLVFLAMLPLKIEHIVTNLERKFDATATSAMTTETENLFSSYITKNVLPNLHKGTCHTTIDPGCVSVVSGSSPIDKLYRGWRDGKLEQKLAKNHGLVFGKEGSHYVMTVNGQNFDVNKDNIFDFTDSKGNKVTTASRTAINDAFNKAISDETFVKQAYLRFKYNKLLVRKYDTRLCVIICKPGNKIKDSLADRKLAAKAYIVQRVISPLNESYGLILQCMMGGVTNCETTPEDAQAGEDMRQSKFQTKLQAQLAQYAAGDTEKLASLVSKANDISKDGFTKYFAKQLGEKIAGKAGGKLAGNTVPVVGWALLIGSLVELGKDIGPLVQYAGYAANSAAAVRLYQTYNTVASEMTSGNTDAAELGSFTEALSTNLSGSSDNQSDATRTPLYNSLFGDSTSTTASTFSSVLSGAASADSSSSTYTCNPISDGGSRTPVPIGKLVCSEEELAKGNTFANEVSATVNGITSSIPGLNYLLKAVNIANKAIGSAIGTAFNGACYNPPLSWLGCDDAANYIGKIGSNLMSDLMHKMIVSPIDDAMSGGRTFDMMAAGADASYNESCQIELGCAQISDATVAQIRNEQESEQKREFDSQSMFARVFSTSSPYSLVSRLAMDMPTSMLSATSASLANIITNPLSKISSVFSSIFSVSNAFAATTAQPDPFGIPQSGYASIPPDPETYWDANCVNGPMATYDDSTQTLDISKWLNNDPAFEQDGQPNTAQDPSTGEQINLKTNPCLLIQSTAQSAGAIFNNSLIPADEQNTGAD